MSFRCHQSLASLEVLQYPALLTNVCINIIFIVVLAGDRQTEVSLFYIQSTLVISKSKGPSETLRDIRTSTYQICRIEENTNRATKFHK